MTRFVADQRTIDAMSALCPAFGVRSNNRLITKALALAKVAFENADPNGVLTIISPDGISTQVYLREPPPVPPAPRPRLRLVHSR